MNTTKSTTARLLAHVTDECSSFDLEKAYEEMLDDCFSFESLGGIFATMQPSSVLLKCDPIAYRCGMINFEDSEDLVEIGDNYYRREEAEAARDSFVEELEIELADFESCGQSKDFATIAELQADILTCQKYSF